MTVVIPTRNRWDVLRGALLSALSQRPIAVEVIVVDDASEQPPSTASLLDETTVIRHQVHRGVSAARNAGIAAAQAEWIAFLDDDDLWAPSRLARLIDVAVGEDAEFAYTSAVVVDPELCVVGLLPAPDPSGLSAQLLRGNAVPGGGSGVIARADFLRHSGGFDEQLSFAADWDLWLRLATAGKGAALPEPSLAYRHHAGSWALRGDQIRADVERVVSKHAHLARRFGVEFDQPAFDRDLAHSLWWAGRRRRAAGAYLAAGVRNRDPRALIRSPGALLSPRTARRLRLSAAAPDPDWLQRYRTGEQPSLRPRAS